ncbi:MAG: VaFE repeat-containing surface-anchored protein [Propionibacteriaceae bacterium]|nr:VaFE repeat-containing surface-anchored protein [Propionibacteriaceae bacterium]
MRLRKVVATLVAALVLLVSLTATRANAWTAVEGSGPAGGYQSMTGVGEGAWSTRSLTTFSTYLMPGGAGRWICIDPLERVPSVISTNTTQVSNPKVAWMMHTYSLTKDPYQAAALAYWVKRQYPSSGGEEAARQVAANEPTDWAAMQNYITAMDAQANKYAGPYELVMNLTETGATPVVRSTLSKQPLKFLTPADGPRFETNPQVRLTFGNATFTDGQTSKIVDANTAFTYRTTDRTKPVTATASVAGLPGTTMTLYAEAGFQRMIGRGIPTNDPLSATATIEAFQETPVIETVSSAVAGIKIGEPITDLIRVTRGKPNTSMVVPAVLYGPFDSKPTQRQDAPSGAPVAFRTDVTIRLDARGDGQATSAGFTPTKPGWYTWDVNWAGDANNAAFNHEFGVPAETGFMSVFTPTMTTVSSAANGELKVGDQVTDELKITGGRPGATVQVDVVLYGPVADEPVEAATAPAGTPEATRETLSVKLDAQGNATVTSTPYTVEETGWYSYTGTVRADESHEAFSHNYGVASETGHLRKRTPEISTVTSAVAGIRVGDPIRDEITVTGGRPGSTVIVDATLYGPVAEQPVEAATAPEGAAVAWSGEISITLDAQGNGTGTTADYIPAAAGWYSYTGTLRGDTSHETFVHNYGVTSETGQVLRYQPEATTQTSDTLIDGPGELTDTIDATNGKPGAAFSGTSTLFGPFEVDPVGQPLNPDTDPVVGISTFEGSFDDEGNATVVSTAQTVSEAGYYVWAEQIAADVNNEESQWPDAVTSETSLWLDMEVASQVSAQLALVGHTITDDVTVTGVKSSIGDTPIDYTLTGTLYAAPAVEGSCEAVDWADAAVADSFTEQLAAGDVPADGTWSLTGLGEHTVKELGCLTYGYELTAQAGEDAITAIHAPGHVTQTTLVTQPEIETKAHDKADGDQHLHGATEQVIVDVVPYVGLVPGKEYTVEGILMDKATGEPLSPEITATTTFTPTEPSGQVELEFVVSVAHMYKTIVVFETLFHEGREIAIHADIDDEQQTIWWTKIGTTATDKADGDSFLNNAGDKQVVDVVAYQGLIPGKTYLIEGELMDKASGEPLLLASKASTTFTPTTPDGEVELEFTVVADHQGKVLVAFETVSLEGNTVAVHADINDVAQTVYWPDLRTSATDQADGDKQLLAAGGTIVDKVTYTGLQPGETYTVRGELMDKATGEGTGILGEASFTAETADGVVDVLFTVPGGYANKTLVVFETLFHGDVEITAHADLNDVEQTVTIARTSGGGISTGDVPELGTAGGGPAWPLIAVGAVALLGAAGVGARTLRTRKTGA